MNTQNILLDISNRGHSELYMDKSPNEYVFQKYCDFVESGKYPYLEQVVDYILSMSPELSEQRDNLKTHVYYSSQKFDNVKEQKYVQNMLADGWLVLNQAVAESMLGQKIFAMWQADGLFGTLTKENTFKLIKDADGNIFLMPPRSKKRGYAVRRLFAEEYVVFYKTQNS